MIKKILTLCVTSLALLTAPFTVSAEITKDTTINIIVPRNPGGLQDMAARFIQHGLNKEGYKAVVINKPGGADTIALNLLKQSENTKENVYLFSFTHSNLYHPYIFEKPLYDVSKDVKPVMYIGEFGLHFYVPKKLGVSNEQELKNYVKDNKVFVGSSSVGSSGHLLSLTSFKDNIDNVTFSFYKSDGENMLALLRGDLTFTLGASSLVNSMGDKLADYNNVKIKYPVPIWQGLVADKSMSDTDVKQLNEILNNVVKDNEVIEKFKGMGEPVPPGGSVVEFQNLINETIDAGKNLPKMVKAQ